MSGTVTNGTPVIFNGNIHKDLIFEEVQPTKFFPTNINNLSQPFNKISTPSPTLSQPRELFKKTKHACNLPLFTLSEVDINGHFGCFRFPVSIALCSARERDFFQMKKYMNRMFFPSKYYFREEEKLIEDSFIRKKQKSINNEITNEEQEIINEDRLNEILKSQMDPKLFKEGLKTNIFYSSFPQTDMSVEKLTKEIKEEEKEEEEEKEKGSSFQLKLTKDDEERRKSFKPVDYVTFKPNYHLLFSHTTFQPSHSSSLLNELYSNVIMKKRREEEKKRFFSNLINKKGKSQKPKTSVSRHPLQQRNLQWESFSGRAVHTIWYFIDMETEEFDVERDGAYLRQLDQLYQNIIIVYTRNFKPNIDKIHPNYYPYTFSDTKELQKIFDLNFKNVCAVYNLHEKDEYCFERLLSITRENVNSAHGDKWFTIFNEYSPIGFCDIKLYQDSHGSLDGNDGFNDVYDAINNAKEFIYIAGWSLWHKLKLRYDKEIIGELLKRKAEEGVHVCLYIWYDFKDFMETRNIQTKKYFEGSKVNVDLSSRSSQFFHSFIYTHHQKIVVCDSDGELLAFIGGLDLTAARSDFPCHPLFYENSTLDIDIADYAPKDPETMKEAFFNPSYNNERYDKKSGHEHPRLPWHDVMAQIRGDIVLDVLDHFEAMWRKANPNVGHMKHERLTRNIEKGELSLVGNWKCQLFRSVSKRQLFKTKLHKTVETSAGIQTAYLSAIQKADCFIYIENQYFVGGSKLWGNRAMRHTAPNEIPIALVDKIKEKIKLNQPFKVYIIIPYHPYGKLSAVDVLGVLYFEYTTIQMMYREIARYLRNRNITNRHPEDYLVFCCLGNVEWTPSGYKKEMIYVHSKLMIIDDEYLIVGSANLNERSMNGNRDTEIAIGCVESVLSTSQVQKFRQNLWKEHFGLFEQRNMAMVESASNKYLFHSVLSEIVNMDPKEDIVFDCFRDLAIRNEENFHATRLLQGHLMKCPFYVYQDGTLKPKLYPSEDTVRFSGKRARFLPKRVFV